MAPKGPDLHDLSGVRVLVVEDDTVILLELEAELRDAGAVVVGPCQSVAEAMPIAETAEIDVAILDFGLRGETASPIARRLAARGTPFFFYTGQFPTDPGFAEWVGRKVVQKPASPDTLIAAVAKLRTG